MTRFWILKNPDAVPYYSPVKPSEPEYFKLPGRSFVNPSSIVDISEESLNSFRELWSQTDPDLGITITRHHLPL